MSRYQIILKKESTKIKLHLIVLCITRPCAKIKFLAKADKKISPFVNNIQKLNKLYLTVPLTQDQNPCATEWVE